MAEFENVNAETGAVFLNGSPAFEQTKHIAVIQNYCFSVRLFGSNGRFVLGFEDQN